MTIRIRETVCGRLSSEERERERLNSIDSDVCTWFVIELARWRRLLGWRRSSHVGLVDGGLMSVNQKSKSNRKLLDTESNPKNQKQKKRRETFLKQVFAWLSYFYFFISIFYRTFLRIKVQLKTKTHLESDFKSDSLLWFQEGESEPGSF